MGSNHQARTLVGDSTSCSFIGRISYEHTVTASLFLDEPFEPFDNSCVLFQVQKADFFYRVCKLSLSFLLISHSMEWLTFFFSRCHMRPLSVVADLLLSNLNDELLKLYLVIKNMFSVNRCASFIPLLLFV